MASKKQPVLPFPDSPQSPYTPGVAVDDLVYVSGQGPLDPRTGEIQEGTIEEQTRLTMDNIKRILEQANCTMNDCVKMNVYISDLSFYDRFNSVYTSYFDKPLPARTLVQAGLLGIMVEIDAIAIRGAGAGTR